MRYKRKRCHLVLCVAVALWLQGYTAFCSARGTESLAETTQLFYRGQFIDAAAMARRYLKTHPGNPQGSILLGRALLALGNYLGAYSELVRLVHANPRNIDALYYLSKASMLLSQREYQELFRRSPDFYRVHQLVAESYAAQDKKGQAEEEYKRALRTAPPSSELLDALADLEREAFQFNDAARHYRRAAEISPGDYGAWYGSGGCALFNHDFPEAIAYFRKATRIEPRSAAARLALGDALLRNNQSAAAVRELKVATAIQPNMRQAFSLLAHAYARLGQTQLAGEALEHERRLARARDERLERILETQERRVLVAPQ